MPHFNESDLPPGLPPEHIEQFRRQALNNENATNELIGFFRDLQPGELIILSKILHILTNSDYGPALAAHYEAWADAALQYHHKVCHICGEDHADRFLASHPQGKMTPSEAVPESDGSSEYLSQVDRNFEYPDGVEPHLTRDQTDIIRIYNLDTVYSVTGDGMKYEGVVCRGCGLNYTSPEDRALRPVDGCHGCHQKAKFG